MQTSKSKNQTEGWADVIRGLKQPALPKVLKQKFYGETRMVGQKDWARMVECLTAGACRSYLLDPDNQVMLHNAWAMSIKGGTSKKVKLRYRVICCSDTEVWNDNDVKK